MPLHLICLQRATVPHVKPFRAGINQALQFGGHRMRVIFKGRTYRMFGSDNTADQNAGCNKVAYHCVLASQFHSD